MQVVLRDKDDWESQNEMAVLLAAIGEGRKALARFKKIYKHNRQDVEVSKCMARLYHQLGKPDEAIKVILVWGKSTAEELLKNCCCMLH